MFASNGKGEQVCVLAHSHGEMGQIRLLGRLVDKFQRQAAKFSVVNPLLEFDCTLGDRRHLFRVAVECDLYNQ